MGKNSKKGKVSKPEDLKKHLEVVTEILQHAQYLLGNAKAMLLCEPEIYKFIKQTPFLTKVGSLFFDLCIIETNKLYSGGVDDFCIRNLLDHLVKISTDPIWNNKIPVDKIESWQIDLASDNMSRKIKDVIILRNKYVAHTAKEEPTGQNTLFYTDISDLIFYGQNIVNELSQSIFNEEVPLTNFAGQDSMEFIKKSMGKV